MLFRCEQQMSEPQEIVVGVGVAHYKSAFMRACEWFNLLTCQNLMVVRNQMRESAVAPKGDSEGLENPHWLTSGRPSTTEATRIG